MKAQQLNRLTTGSFVATALLASFVTLPPKLALAASASLSSASSADSTNSDYEYVPASTMSMDGKVLGFVPFFGAGIGYMDRSSRYETEGVPSDIRLLGSYYFEEKPFVLDLGLGLRHQSYSQKIGGKETTSGNIEGALRYQLQDAWSAGGVVQMMAGKGKHVGARSENAQFLGVQLIKEIPVKLDFPSVLRVGGRLMTDLNVSKEQVNYAMVEVALGFPEVQTVARNDRPAYRPVAKLVPQKIVIQDEIKKDARNSQFKIDSAEIALAQKEYLQRFAMAVANRNQIVERLHVVGHADDTGTPQHNMQLSKKRAEAVAAELRAAGVPAGMITIDWKGETMPLVAGEAEAQRSVNRRVEIQFVNVQDQTALSEIVDSISR